MDALVRVSADLRQREGDHRDQYSLLSLHEIQRKPRRDLSTDPMQYDRKSKPLGLISINLTRQYSWQDQLY